MKKLIRTVLPLLAIMVAASTAQAQATSSAPPATGGAAAPAVKADRKDPGTATIISVVVPGGGQIYAGDTMRGVKILGVAVGAPIVTGIAASALCGVTVSAGGCGTAAALGLVGLAASVGAWVYGIIDAKPTTERMNQANGHAGLTVTPTVATTLSGGAGVGLQVTF